MLVFVIRRLLSAVPVLLVVSFVTFVLIWLVPGDVSSTIAGLDATPEQLEEVRERLGLNDNILVRAGHWYAAVLRGDLGHSYLMKQTVVEAVLQRAPVTLSLSLIALIIAVVLGLLSGVVASIHHNTWSDQTMMGLALLGLSLPNFWFGLVLIYTFAVMLPWLPTGGYVSPAVSLWGWLRAMLLPSLTLGLTQMGVIARMTRSSMLEVLRVDFIRTARAKGVSERDVVRRHAVPNAMIPVVTVIGVIVGVMFGGTVVIEQVFSLPGVGRLIIGAVQRRDYPVIQGGLLLTAVIFVVINVLVDVVYGLLDPRVRYVD